MSGRRAPLVAVAALLSVIASAGCSSDATAPIDPAPTPPTSAEEALATSTAGPPSTGVPGIDDPDAMCRGWSRVQATLYVLQIAAGFGALDDAALARLELVAAPAVVADADLVASSWPADLDGERTAATSIFLAPLATRAHAAVGALAAAGVDATAQAALADAWRSALASYDPDAGPVIEPRVGADLAAELDAAVPAYVSVVPRLADDRSLDVEPDAASAVPDTLDHVDQHCPDLSSIGFGDT